MGNEIVDCHYCNYGCCSSPDDKRVACYVEDNGYFSHWIEEGKSKQEAETCEWFSFCDVFPKY